MELGALPPLPGGFVGATPPELAGLELGANPPAAPVVDVAVVEVEVTTVEDSSEEVCLVVIAVELCDEKDEVDVESPLVSEEERVACEDADASD